MPERQSLEEAMKELRDSVWAILAPPLERIAGALSRHIERHPRLYRWL